MNNQRKNKKFQEKEVNRMKGLMVLILSVALGLILGLAFPAVAAAQLGDVDGNGIINFVGDAMLAAQAAAGLVQLTPEQVLAADIDGDGKVTNYDARLIAAYALGYIDSFDNVLSQGDVDGNGVVNYKDTILAIQAAAGVIQLTPEQTLAADMDGNGVINWADIPLLVRKGYANLPSLPYGQFSAQVRQRVDQNGDGKFDKADIAILQQQAWQGYASQLEQARQNALAIYAPYVSQLGQTKQKTGSFSDEVGFPVVPSMGGTGSKSNLLIKK